MKQYGIIGNPLTHSFSSRYFSDKFHHLALSDARFDIFPISTINELPELIEHNPYLKGLSVTIPYKESVIPFLDAIDDTAEAIGAVNSIKISREGTVPLLTGYNTDAAAFEQALCEAGTLPEDALLLGTGGASKAVAYVLKKLGIAFLQVSRTPKKGVIVYDDIDETMLHKHPLIINATPVGMYPHINEKPLLPYQALSKAHYLFDLIYNPEQTAFLTEGERHGAKIKNGLSMLYRQADISWEIWNL